MAGRDRKSNGERRPKGDKRTLRKSCQKNVMDFHKLVHETLCFRLEWERNIGLWRGGSKSQAVHKTKTLQSGANLFQNNV